jgi:starvation-inducible DNA-binding protein
MENQRLINFLNQLLSNQFILYVKLHRYHWYIQGRNFFRLHEYFEALYSRFSSEADVLAERILAIGGKPLATMSMFIKQGTLDEANADDTESEIINQLISDLNEICKEIREIGLPLAEEENDEPTADVLIGQLTYFEKAIWMLESFLNEK